MLIAHNTQNVASGFGSGSIGIAGENKFPNPFCDIASTYLPSDIIQIFELCEFLYLTCGTYRSAARKVVRYFLTDVLLNGETEADRDDYTTYLNKDLHILNILADIGDEFMTYGNSFISVYLPFDRFLICPECNMQYHVSALPYKFNLAKLEFNAECKSKSCGYKGAFIRADRKSVDKKRIYIKRWNPKEIKLRYHPISGACEYYLEINSEFIDKIKDGKPFYLNNTPWEIVECISQTKKSETPLFRFNEGQLFHLKDSCLAGLPIYGWGIPPIIPNFKLAYYIQVLRRYDEAIAFDFIVPHRILYPDAQSPGPAGMDALQATSMGVFMSYMQNMIKQHRKDPTSIQAAPFKIGYQQIGGEGAALAPKDSIALALDELLNAVGFPADLYKGTLQLQTAPVALRLFEQSWGVLVTGYDDILNWIIERIGTHLGWGDITAELQSVTLADDLERKALSLQAAAGMDISKGTAYRPFGIDFIDEQQKVVDEQQKIQELQMEAQEEQNALELQQGGGSGPQGDAGVGATPGDVEDQAKEIAYQLVTQTPESLRRGELLKIKRSNSTLHALVLQEMDKLRQEMSRQGQAMMLEQAKANPGEKMAMAEDLKQLPSPLRINIDIMSAVSDYNRQDLRKIAMDIKRKVKGASRGFSFIYKHLEGII